MENFFRCFLAIHIAAGTTGLLVAPIAMLTVKGGKAHRLWGKVFFYAMCVIAATTVGMTSVHPNLFLLAIAFFSLQFAISGYRALYHKPVGGQIRLNWMDWAPIFLAAVAGIVLLGLARELFAEGNSFGYVLLVFGLISLLTGAHQAYRLVRPPLDPKAWYYAHMRGMLASYIAMVTAFSAVNLNFLPPIVQWLWPAILGVPLTRYWVNSYRTKFEATKALKVVPTT